MSSAGHKAQTEIESRDRGDSESLIETLKTKRGVTVRRSGKGHERRRCEGRAEVASKRSERAKAQEGNELGVGVTAAFEPRIIDWSKALKAGRQELGGFFGNQRRGSLTTRGHRGVTSSAG
jgi:hypothetical protein